LSNGKALKYFERDYHLFYRLNVKDAIKNNIGANNEEKIEKRRI